jgi:hypothetical protein
VRDGNLWQVNADGGGAHALTSYPERPFRAVRWQPGGSLLAVEFELYQQTIDLYDLATGALHPLTAGGREREPEWLNPSTLLYTAPAARQARAIWQIGLDGSGAALLAGSGRPGVSDRQAAGARDGSALALVSTRRARPSVWLRRTGRSRSWRCFRRRRAGRNAAADLVQPAGRRGGDARGGRALAARPGAAGEGFQTIAWDRRRGGRPGPCRGRDQADRGAGWRRRAALERYATARVLDAAEIGTLQLQVNQWGDVRLQDARNLQVAVPARGARHARRRGQRAGRAVLQAPEGEYDVVLLRDGVRREFAGIQVAAGQTTTRASTCSSAGWSSRCCSRPGGPSTTASTWRSRAATTRCARPSPSSTRAPRTSCCPRAAMTWSPNTAACGGPYTASR